MRGTRSGSAVCGVRLDLLTRGVRAGVATLAAAASVATATGARAQVPLAGHGVPVAAHPLHARLAEADVVAVGVIAAVEPGRIHVRELVPLLGDAPSRIQIKRSPSRPPEVQPGSGALLILRGARSPYLLSAPEGQTAAVPSFDPGARSLWERSVARLLAAQGNPTRQRDVYLEWLDSPEPVLQREALRALADRGSPFHPLPAAVARARARVALDPSADPETRRGSAAVAALSREGARSLVEGVPGDHAEPADIGVLVIALQAGVAHEVPETGDAFVRALRSPNAATRSGALRLVSLSLDDPEVRDELARLAVEDPDPRMRQAAGRALARTRE